MESLKQKKLRKGCFEIDYIRVWATDKIRTG